MGRSSEQLHDEFHKACRELTRTNPRFHAVKLAQVDRILDEWLNDHAHQPDCRCDHCTNHPVLRRHLRA